MRSGQVWVALEQGHELPQHFLAPARVEELKVVFQLQVYIGVCSHGGM